MPDLGLLLDVDGPIASPETRTVAAPGLLDDLLRLASAGVPIAFITGRSDRFIADAVLGPLIAKDLGGALARGGAGMFGVFEKGAAWSEITGAGLAPVVVDDAVALPGSAVDAIRDLVEARFASSMFFDETKRAMISVEQRTDIGDETYRAEQQAFGEAAFELLVRLGLGVRDGAREHPDHAGAIPFRLDPTIISTDIESVTLDKDRGAQRALEYFRTRGPLPTRWRSVGDSRSDYKMADHLHSSGFDVAHVDVRPADGIPDRPYPVITVGDRIHDDAGAAFLRYCVAELGLE